MEATAGRPNVVRRLYDWVLSWAYKPQGQLALFVLAFAESSFFPIPPDVLLVAMVLGARERWFRLALICSVASVVGGLVGYLIGWGLWAGVDDFFYRYVPGFTPETFNHVAGLYQKWDFWIVFVAAFTPIPYKLITVTAGVFQVNLLMFMVASVVGRSARFFLVAWLLHRFGAPIKSFIDRRFNLLATLFTALLIGGFVVVKALL